MNPWRRRPNQPPKPDDSISLEDIEWRIGASEVRPHEEEPEDAEERPVWIGEEEAAAAAAASAAAEIGAAPSDVPAKPSVVPKPRKKAASRRAAQQAHPIPPRTRRAAAVEPHAHPVVGAAPRRLTLWRDVSALLFGAIAIVLIAQLALGNRGETATGTSSPGASDAPTDVAVIGTDTPAPTSEFTIGPVINPSLIPVIEATPTPVPIITLPPTPVPTPRITPRPTVKPATTPKPTVAPTPVVTPVPSPVPTVTPTVVTSLTCSPGADVVPYTVTCSATATGESLAWEWALDGVTVAGSSSSNTIAITTTGTHVIQVTASGAGGTDSQQTTTEASAPSPTP